MRVQAKLFQRNPMTSGNILIAQMIETLPFETTNPANRLELEHGWEFLPDPSGKMTYAQAAAETDWRSARVGLSWNVQFADLRDYMGAGWYRRQIELPSYSDTRHVLLKFGAVDYFCEVFVNAVSIGNHEGGYTPFSFDLSRVAKSGKNLLMVRVIDPPMNEVENRALFPDMMYNEIPHGKQNWYVQNSGIWQGVRLEFCPSIYIERADVTPRINGEFTASIRLSGMGLNADAGVANRTTIQASIFDATGHTVFEKSEDVGTRNIWELNGQVANPRLWSPESPHLYTMEIGLSGAVEYRRKIRFGFRDLQARAGKLYFNGHPFYMIAALDQDFYPETIHTPASEEFVRDMMLKAKRLGINTLRCHLKVAHPVYLDVADELGMLVWAELPSWSDSWFPCDHFSLRAALRGEQMFAEILERDWNHPCITVQTIMNESWGINLGQPEQRQWLRDAFDRIKSSVAPLGRLVIDNSPCEGNFHLKTDVEDFHQYYSMPDQAGLWDKWVDELASRPHWTYSPYGDAERTGDEPIVVSEFGNWGLPVLPPLESLPWWFQYSFGGREVTNPGGVFKRFEEYGFGTMYGDYNEFATESQWHQFLSLKHEIESIRAHGNIQGYVITAITDVHWEVNGILDMWRNPKVYADELPLFQAPDVLVPRPMKRTCFAGESLSCEVLLSHYSRFDLTGARLRWNMDGAAGQIPVPGAASGTVVKVGDLEFHAPDVQDARAIRVFFELRLRNGMRIAENFVEFFIHPARHRGTRHDVRVYDPAGVYPKLPGNLAESAERDRENHVLVATVLDDSVRGHMAKGGAAVILIDSEEALPSNAGITAKTRAGTELDGRWFSNFNWIRWNRPPFQDMTFTKILGFESAAVAPNLVLPDVPASSFEDVLCGATFGWLHKNSAIALQAGAGDGRMIITTFRFHDYGRDAYATALLNSLIGYVQSDACRPSLQLGPAMNSQEA